MIALNSKGFEIALDIKRHLLRVKLYLFLHSKSKKVFQHDWTEESIKYRAIHIAPNSFDIVGVFYPPTTSQISLF